MHTLELFTALCCLVLFLVGFELIRTASVQAPVVVEALVRLLWGL
jgi:hypothetical protein